MDESGLPRGEPPGGFEEIHLAARHRETERVASLLRRGVDPNVRNRREPNGDGGNTPLWFAAQGARPGGVPIATALLDAGARVDEHCEHGTTALHLAASWGHLDVVRFLVDRGADIRARDDDGATALGSLQATRKRVQDEVGRNAGPPGGKEWLNKVPAVIEFLAACENPAPVVTEEKVEASEDDLEPMVVSPATRRANFWLFIALVVFAIAFTIVIFLWMRGVVKANGGIADPQRRTTSLSIPSRKPAAKFVFALLTSAPCFT